MSECNFDVKIGCDGTEDAQLYSPVQLHLEMNFQKLNKLMGELCTCVGRSNVPLLVVEYPSIGCTPLSFSDDYEQGSHKSGNRLYSWAHPREKETVRFYKNIQKEFQKLTKLDNLCFLRAKLYDIARNASLQRSKVKGAISLDPAFVEVFSEVVRRISVQFLNSPVMALLEVFQSATIKLELSSFHDFPVETQNSILRLVSLRQWFSEANFQSMAAIKGELIFHLTIPKVCSLRFKADSAILLWINKVCH